jgi:hypothetical protein
MLTHKKNLTQKPVIEQFDKAQTEMKALGERGFTPEIMAKLRTANDKNWSEVVDLLLQQERARELDSEIASAETEKSNLNDELVVLRERIQKLEKKVVSSACAKNFVDFEIHGGDSDE